MSFTAEQLHKSNLLGGAMRWSFLLFTMLMISKIVVGQTNGAYNCTIKDAVIENKISNKVISIDSNSESFICDEIVTRQECKNLAIANLRDKVVSETGLKIESSTISSESLSLSSTGEETYETSGKNDIRSDILAKIEGKIDCEFVERKMERSTYSWFARSGAVVAGGLAFYQFTLKNDALNDAEDLEKKANSTSVSSEKTSYLNQAKDKRDEAAQLELQQNLLLGITAGLVLLDLLFLGLDYQDAERWNNNISFAPELENSKPRYTLAYKFHF